MKVLMKYYDLALELITRQETEFETDDFDELVADLDVDFEGEANGTLVGAIVVEGLPPGPPNSAVVQTDAMLLRVLEFRLGGQRVDHTGEES